MNGLGNRVSRRWRVALVLSIATLAYGILYGIGVLTSFILGVGGAVTDPTTLVVLIPIGLVLLIPGLALGFWIIVRLIDYAAVSVANALAEQDQEKFGP